MMGKIIFQCKYFKVRVRDLVIVAVLLLLLFFGLRSCQQKNIEKKKEEKIENLCTMINENLNDLDKLLSRADICSSEWFDDVDDYINRLKDQNRILEKKEKQKFQDVYKLQKDIEKKMQTFRTKQTNKDVEELRKSVKKYKKHYDNTCTFEKKGE